MARDWHRDSRGGFWGIGPDGKRAWIYFPPLTNDKLKNGIIIQAPHFSPLMDSTIPVKDKRRAESTLGPICVKYRYMVAMAIFPGHILALPLTTHSGRGLQSLPKHVIDEHIGIKFEKAEYVNQAHHPPLEIEAQPINDTLWMKPTSYVHMTIPFSVETRAGAPGAKDVMYCGRLNNRSFKMLWDVWTGILQNKIVAVGMGAMAFKDGIAVIQGRARAEGLVDAKVPEKNAWTAVAAVR